MEAIKQAIETALETWNYVGLRCDQRNLDIGDELGRSQRWDDDQPTGESLQGISAINAERADAIEMIGCYMSLGTLYVIGCQGGYMTGEDQGEIEMYDAVVVAKF